MKIHRAAPPRFYLLFVTMTLAICVLLLAFTLSLRAASRQFEHALIAQRQAVLVEGIRCDAIDLASFPEHQEALRALLRHVETWLGLRKRAPFDF